jgi:Integrase core domain
MSSTDKWDNAASEAFFSTLEHEVLSRHHFATEAEARAVITAWCHDLYNARRGTALQGCCRQSSTKESLPSNRRQHNERLHDFGGSTEVFLGVVWVPPVYTAKGTYPVCCTAVKRRV